MPCSAPRTGEICEQKRSKWRKLTHQQCEQIKSFNRRSSTVMRKAAALVKKCGAQVCVVSYYEPNAKVKVWPEDEDVAKAIINKYREAAVKHKGASKNHELNLCGVLESKKKELEQEMGLDDKELDKLSGDSLMDLSIFLESKLHTLDSTIKSVEAKPINVLPYGGEEINNWQTQSINNCNLVDKELHQPSNPLRFNANCSNSGMLTGFEGQSLYTTPTWPCQCYHHDKNFQFGLANCSVNGMRTGLENQSVFGRCGSSSSTGQLGILQAESGFGRRYNFGLLGLENYQNHLLGDQRTMPAFGKAGNFGVVRQDKLIDNSLPSQQFMAFPEPMPSPFDALVYGGSSFWPEPLQVQMN